MNLTPQQQDALAALMDGGNVSGFPYIGEDSEIGAGRGARRLGGVLTLGLSSAVRHRIQNQARERAQRMVAEGRIPGAAATPAAAEAAAQGASPQGQQLAAAAQLGGQVAVQQAMYQQVGFVPQGQFSGFLGINDVLVPAAVGPVAGEASIVQPAQEPTQLHRFTFQAVDPTGGFSPDQANAFVRVRGIFIGMQPCFTSQAGIPLTMLAANATGIIIGTRLLYPGQACTVQYQNVGPVPLLVAGGGVGPHR